MERHQHAMVKFLSRLGKVWVYASHKPEVLTTSIMVSVGNVPPLGTKRYPLPLIAFKFFSCQHRTTGVLCQFSDFSGFVWTFLRINWVFNAFMCIIKIWTTCTCSSAYELIEKSNICPWLHALVPCKKWEWISNTGAPLIAGKTLRCLVFKF